MPTARKNAPTDHEPSDTWMSLYDAADALGEGRHKLLGLIIAKALDGKVIAGRTVVTRESVERRKQEKAEQERAGAAE